jgi:hypothetical protein
MASWTSLHGPVLGVMLPYVNFGGKKATYGDFGRGAVKRHKSFPPVPLTTREFPGHEYG